MDEAKNKAAGKKTPRKGPAKRTGKMETSAPARGTIAAAPKSRISPEERYRMIADAAYFRARKRNFRGGSDVEDWLAAEAEVDARLLAKD